MNIVHKMKANGKPNMIYMGALDTNLHCNDEASNNIYFRQTPVVGSSNNTIVTYTDKYTMSIDNIVSFNKRMLQLYQYLIEKYEYIDLNILDMPGYVKISLPIIEISKKVGVDAINIDQLLKKLISSEDEKQLSSIGFSAHIEEDPSYDDALVVYLEGNVLHTGNIDSYNYMQILSNAIINIIKNMANDISLARTTWIVDSEWNKVGYITQYTNFEDMVLRSTAQFEPINGRFEVDENMYQLLKEINTNPIKIGDESVILKTLYSCESHLDFDTRYGLDMYIAFPKENLEVLSKIHNSINDKEFDEYFEIEDTEGMVVIRSKYIPYLKLIQKIGFVSAKQKLLDVLSNFFGY